MTPPYRHDPTALNRRIDRAGRVSARKVAWKASSVSCRSPSIARQTRNTIAPCRAISAVKASYAVGLLSPWSCRQKNAPIGISPKTG
jgi:hypothetical protein